MPAYESFWKRSPIATSAISFIAIFCDLIGHSRYGIVIAVFALPFDDRASGRGPGMLMNCIHTSVAMTKEHSGRAPSEVAPRESSGLPTVSFHTPKTQLKTLIRYVFAIVNGGRPAYVHMCRLNFPELGRGDWCHCLLESNAGSSDVHPT